MKTTDLHRLKIHEVTAEMNGHLARILAKNHARPLGTRISFSVSGKDFVAVLEPHWDQSRGARVGASCFKKTGAAIRRPKLSALDTSRRSWGD